MTDTITVKNLVKKYKKAEKNAVDDISFNFLIALVGSAVFEYQAVMGYENYSVYHRTFWANQILAVIFIIALYYCTKTVRGMIIK